MGRKPYPPYPPNYRIVDEIGGYSRRCFVLELLYLKYESKEEAQIFEEIELAVSNILRKHQNVDKFELIKQDRFDTDLSSGLRLGR